MSTEYSIHYGLEDTAAQNRSCSTANSTSKNDSHSGASEIRNNYLSAGGSVEARAPPAYSPSDAFHYPDGVHVDLPSEVIAAALEGSSAPAATRYEINVSASGSTTHCIQSASRKFMEVKEVLICIGQVLYGVYQHCYLDHTVLTTNHTA